MKAADARPRGCYLAALACISALACGPRISISDADSTSSTSMSGDDADGMSRTQPGNDDSSPATTGVVTTSSSSTTTGATTGFDFVSPPDVGGPSRPCSVVAQDCPVGSQCKPLGENGEWTETSCFPIDPDGAAPGDPCTIESHTRSGIDDCGAGAMCWPRDPNGLEGTCVAFCLADGDSLVCDDPGVLCHMDGTAAICLPCCDPLDDQCPAGSCQFIAETFGCIARENGSGILGDGCSGPDQCASGHECVAGHLVPGCQDEGCCTPYCVADAIDPCPDPFPPGSCQELFAPDANPPWCIDYPLGRCLLPR